MKFFTDETGAKFEADKDWNKILPSLPDGHIVIRPIAEPTINPKYMKSISPDEVKKFKNPEAQGAE